MLSVPRTARQCKIAMRSRSDPQSGDLAEVELLDSVAKSVEESKKQVETLINRTEEEDVLRRLLDVHTDLYSGLQQYKERRSALKGSGGAEAQGPRDVLAAGSDAQASASNSALLAGTCQALVLPLTPFYIAGRHTGMPSDDSCVAHVRSASARQRAEAAESLATAILFCALSHTEASKGLTSMSP